MAVAASPGALRNAPIPIPAAEAVERYFQLSLFLLIVAGFATLAGTGQLDMPSVAAVCAALAVRGYLLLRGRTLVLPRRWTSLATLAYLVFYGADLLLVSENYVTASVHLVLFTMVVKLFTVQRERDHLYLILLAFLAVLSASVLTVDTLFLASFCLFSLLAVTTFASMEMRRSLAAAGGSGAEPYKTPPLARALSGTGTLLTAGILLGALGLFFALPRLSAGYLSSYSPRNEFVSGFSERVQLGQIGRIKQSNAVVMHIELNDPGEGEAEVPRTLLADLKWRGVALSRFDGRLWYNPRDRSMEIASGEGRFDLWRAQLQRGHEGLRSGGHTLRALRYRVVMEPVGTNVLFLAPVPASLQARIREIGVDDNGAVFNLDRRRMTESYQALSMLAQPRAEVLRSQSGGYAPELLAEYAQLPERMDARIMELARRATADDHTDYDRARTLERYLAANFGYSTQMAETPPADPLAYFLFERKQGHCEYFASAMAVMLRTLGIPSRIVNGFRNGEYNSLTGRYIIRGRDAHSWVEAYLPGYGWMSFDPTPPDPLASGGGWNRFLLYMDAAREFWREWVINYDFAHQRTLTRNASREGVNFMSEARAWGRAQYRRLLGRARALQGAASRSPIEGGAAATAGLLLLLALFNLGRMKRAFRNLRLRRNPQRDPQAAASLWYERMVRALARRGVRKLPAQTPAEFARTIEEPTLRSRVSEFTRHYERARFGESAADAEQLAEKYEELVQG
jgi:transglutaminase-like putative cysteine protease